MLASTVAAVTLPALLTLPTAGAGAASPRPGHDRAPARAAKTHALAAYGKLPLEFVANAGQADTRVRYQAEAAGASFYFTRTKAVFGFTHGAKGVGLELSFVGANRSPLIEGVRPLPGTFNYLIGKDPTKWHAGLRTYREIVYRDVWPGIDVAFHGDASRLKYEFRLAPGADASQIRLRYRGAQRLSLGPVGELRIHTPLGVLPDSRPVSYQAAGSRRVPVESGYRLTGGNGYAFSVGAYDTRRALVIDPGLAYSTFVGGSGSDTGRAIAVDAAGNAYVTGSHQGFPTTVGAFDTSYNGGGTDVFVTKLNASGSALVYSTYLGGSVSDEGFGIAVDSAGHAVVTGRTNSANFPVSAGAFDSSANGGHDAFVTKLSPDGSAPVYSTYLGGSLGDWGNAIALDAAGNAHVTGQTDSATFPTLAALDTTLGGQTDAFVAKLDPAGSVLYSTFLGGGSTESGNGIAADAAGSAYVTGYAGPTFPTTAGASDTTHNGAGDVFVTKLDPGGSGLVYSTYIGGSGWDEATAVAVDGSGNAFVTGRTVLPSTYPTTAGAFDQTYNGGGEDAFVTKLNPTGSALAYSTFLGGSSGGTSAEHAEGIAVDGHGSAVVTGFTPASDFPTTPGAFDTTFNGGDDVFVTKLDPAGSALAYSSFLGGSFVDRGNGIALDSRGDAYVTGETNSNVNFPTTAGAFDTTFNGTNDAFVAKLGIAPAPQTLTLSPANAVNTVGEEHCVTATVTDQYGDPLTGAGVVFSVSGANSVAGAQTTNASGQATFCYTGTVAGEDAINAFADTDGDGAQDTDEPSGAATKTYVEPERADLSLELSVDNPTPNLFEEVTFTLRLTNSGPAPVPVLVSGSPGFTAVNIFANEGGGGGLFQPRQLLVVSDSPSQGFLSASPPAGAETWVVPGTTEPLPPGATATLSLRALVVKAGTLHVLAEVASTSVADPDSAAKNCDSNHDRVPDLLEDDCAALALEATKGAADLSVSLSANDPAPRVGDEVTFTLTVTNSGPQTVPVDTFPLLPHFTRLNVDWSSNLEKVAGSVSVSQGKVDQLPNEVSDVWWNPTAGATLPPGATATMSWRARVLGGGPISVLAQVRRATLGDPDSTENNCDSDLNQVPDNAEDDCAAVMLTALAPDTTPPAIDCTVPDTGLWYGGNVQVPCTASDGDSGLADPADANFVLATSAATGTESSNVATGTHGVCDRAGNCSAAGPYTFKVDKKAPQPSFCESADGVWHAANVTLRCAYADGGVGPASQSVSLTTSVAAGSETSAAAASAGGAQACDAVGNCAPPPADISSNQVDRKAPAITCKAASFTLNQAPAQVIGVATDGGSGPDSQTLSAAANTLSAGSKAVTLTASDIVANTSTQSCLYDVGYSFSGFLAPVNNPSTVNLGKAGRTYPVRWQLRDANGSLVSALDAVSSIAYKAAPCGSLASAPTDALETSTTGGTVLRYDSTANQYVYNWATPTTVGCYALFVKLAGGQVFPAYFNLS